MEDVLNQIYAFLAEYLRTMMLSLEKPTEVLAPVLLQTKLQQPVSLFITATRL